MGLPPWLSSKESTCNAGDARDMGSIPGWGRSPGGRHGNLHCSILAWRIPWTQEHGGYSPWSHRESDTTEVTEHACEDEHGIIFLTATPAADPSELTFSSTPPHSTCLFLQL